MSTTRANLLDSLRTLIEDFGVTEDGATAPVFSDTKLKNRISNGILYLSSNYRDKVGELYLDGENILPDTFFGSSTRDSDYAKNLICLSARLSLLQSLATEASWKNYRLNTRSGVIDLSKIHGQLKEEIADAIAEIDLAVDARTGGYITPKRTPAGSEMLLGEEGEGL